jgi:putative flavoprotein involved in K+ transport
MRTIDTLIIGAGQAGLATSHQLTARGRDHVVIERCAVADRWRTARWDSLRLLTPNWQTRLPGWRYAGADPDGFMPAATFADHLCRYAASFEAPIVTGVAVEAVRAIGRGYLVCTGDGPWRAANVVVATGHAAVPRVPSFHPNVHPDVAQLTPSGYRNPAQLPDGGVLVIGASASGTQIADELARAGRHVILAVGRHHRMVRRHRGVDIMRWLDRMGHFDEVVDPDRPRRAGDGNSLQLVGSPERRDLDLVTLQQSGVTLVGRCQGIDRFDARFASDLQASADAADERLERLLDRIDRFAAADGRKVPVRSALPALATSPAPTRIDLRAAGIRTVVWSTGFRREHSWLHVPVVGRDGEIRHHHGVTAAPGLYTVGQQLQRTRKSTFIDGVGDDAVAVVDHLLARPSPRRVHAVQA